MKETHKGQGPISGREKYRIQRGPADVGARKNAGFSTNGQVIGLPTRDFLIEVTYRMRMKHRVRARSVEEAAELAPTAEIVGVTEVLDIIDTVVSRD